MLIKTCFACKYHEIVQGDQKKISRCIRENCYSQYSKCLATKALKNFLEQENPNRHKTFSAIDHNYSTE